MAPKGRRQAALGVSTSALRRCGWALSAILFAGMFASSAHAQVIQWSLPTERVDGTALSIDELYGTQIYCNGTPVAIVLVPTTVFDAGVLPAADYTCYATALDTDGLESGPSNGGTLTVAPPPAQAPGPPTELVVVAAELPPSTGPPDPPPGGWLMASVVGTVGAGANDDGDTITGLAWPAGSDTDLLVAVVLGWPPSGAVSPPSGWTAVADIDLGGGNRAVALARIAPSASSGSVNVTLPSGDRLGAVMYRVENHAYTEAADILSAATINTTGSPALSSVPAGSLILSTGLGFFGQGPTMASATVPSGFTLGARAGTDDDATHIGTAYDEDNAGGNIGPFNWGSPPSISIWMSLAIPPAAASGETVEAGLNVTAPVLAASANVERTVSAALSVSSPTMTAASDITRSASAALDVAALQLAASASVVRSASAALGLDPLVLAASGTIERSASVAMLVQPAVMSTSGAVERTASASLSVSAPELLSDVLIARIASAALGIQPVVLSGSVGSDKPVSGALSVSAPSLSADSGVERTATAALSVEPLALEAQVSIVRLASGELALLVPVLDANVTGEELTATAALQTPMPVLDVSSVVSRTASGDLSISAPVLNAGVSVQANVEAALIVRAPELAAQVAMARFAEGSLSIPELEISATAFIGAINPVIGLRATVRTIGITAGVTQIGRKGTLQ